MRYVFTGSDVTLPQRIETYIFYNFNRGLFETVNVATIYETLVPNTDIFLII